MIDNMELIRPFLIFDTNDDYYYLQILQRRKDNPNCKSNTRSIKEYFIKNVNYLQEHYEEIKSLCNFFNARAGIRLNKRSFRKTCYKTLQNITAEMLNNDYEFAYKAYNRAAGQCHHDTHKKWLIDLDDCKEDSSIVNEVISCIDGLLPEGKKCYVITPTKNGVHLITSPFNMLEFSKAYPNIEVHKDNPVNLYIP